MKIIIENKIKTLKPGDTVEIIAPASRCSDEDLNALKLLLESWGLKVIVEPDIFGDDLLCANSDEIRFDLLKKALYRPETEAIICARGGYGAMRLIPKLMNLKPPSEPKLFIGMSDITALHLFFMQHWSWPVLHASLSVSKLSQESIQLVKSFIFSDTNIELTGLPLNTLAETIQDLFGTITGGNLCIVTNSIGTAWQINADNKIVLLEEVGERAYRIDRMLEHLIQANIFKNAKAIIFGDFLECNEPDGSSKVADVLKRFSEFITLPVFSLPGVGHGNTNFPILMGKKISCV